MRQVTPDQSWAWHTFAQTSKHTLSLSLASGADTGPLVQSLSRSRSSVGVAPRDCVVGRRGARRVELATTEKRGGGGWGSRVGGLACSIIWICDGDGVHVVASVP